VNIDVERLVATAQALIGCDTRNPPGRESTVTETAIALLRGAGCEVEVFEQTPGRPSVLGRYAGHDGPSLLVNGHLDVVPIIEEEWTHPPFEGTVVGDRLHGRGSADMKGGIAAAIEGLRACRDAGVPVIGRVLFHLVADEETGGAHGTAALVAAGLVEADACIVPEPTGLAVSVAERGSVQVRVTVTGRSGHGSEPAAARSAIADAAAMVRALHAARYYEHPHPLLGSPSANVALIEGGVATNVVAPSCSFVVDRRTLPGDTVDLVLAGLRAKIDAACPGASYRLEVLVDVEASELPADHPFAVFVSATAGTSLTGLSLGTDGRFLRNQLGIPTVIYGPGSIEQAHTTDEWVSIEELTTAARTFARIFSSSGR